MDDLKVGDRIRIRHIGSQWSTLVFTITQVEANPMHRLYAVADGQFGPITKGAYPDQVRLVTDA